MDRNKPFNDLPLLPPKAEVETKEVLKKVIAARSQLAELKGVVNSIPNQSILVDGIVLQEARLSSEIENIVTTSDELYRAAANEDLAANPQAKEVLRYREALWYGFNEVKKRPLSTNLFAEIVRIIKGVNIDIRKTTGTKIGNSLGETVYTPPEGEQVIREKLANLEKFIYEENFDPLIKLAILHYQFEAIHPFIDGNGRTGRIINILFLVEQGLLDTPVLFLSHYILKTKSQYYAGLREVTEKENWIGWILYILEAVETTALEARNKVKEIIAAMNNAAAIVQAKAPKIYKKDLIEVIFKHPYCKVKFIEDAALAKRQAASDYLKVLEELGLLENVKVGRERYYINTVLVDILKK